MNIPLDFTCFQNKKLSTTIGRRRFPSTPILKKYSAAEANLGNCLKSNAHLFPYTDQQLMHYPYIVNPMPIFIAD